MKTEKEIRKIKRGIEDEIRATPKNLIVTLSTLKAQQAILREILRD